MGKLLDKLRGRKSNKWDEEQDLEWVDFDEEEYEDNDEDYDDEYADEEYDYGEDEEDRGYEEEYCAAEEYEADGYADEEYDYGEADEYADEEEEYDYGEDDEYADEEDDEDYAAYEYEDDEYEYEYDEYEDDEEMPPRGLKWVVYKWMSMSLVDHIVAFTGVIVLLLAVVTGTLYLNAKNNEKQIETFAEIGTGLESIQVIGESGLLAIADAHAAKAIAADLEQLEAEANQVDAETGKIEVVLNLTSIQKDLKIKFSNKNSGKLVPNVEFEVEITKPSGDTYTMKDDDKDGIIYQKNIEAGKYKVAITGPEGHSDYSFSREKMSVEVRDTIEYKKVDVADEVKTEAQVNVTQEDTKVNETTIESANADTVEWVESTKTLIQGTEQTAESYEKVDKSKITDPAAKTALGFRLLTGTNTSPYTETGPTATPVAEATEAPTVKPSEEPTVKPSEEPEPTQEPTPIPTETPMPAETPTPIPTETPIPTPTPASSVSPSITPSISPSVSPSVSPSASPSVSPSATPSATPTATPNNAKEDRKSNLKSTSGDQLYVKDSSGNYRKAKYADYYDSNIKEFYKKISKTTGEYKYTGWQTLDGATYFFDKNGNKVTGVQVIQGAKYTFNSDGSLNTGSGVLGIDVSKWNGGIDWNAVRNSGVSYVIIRCGYRGSTTGALIEDPTFKSNIKGALNAGLKVGVYFFTQAVDEVEAVQEASMVLSLIKGYNISFPVFLDVEATSGNNGRADGISVSARTAVCKAFCQTIQNSGYKAGIYANKTWLTSYIDTPSLTGYKIWLAQYAAAPSYTRTKYDMWQYSSKGKISGISGNVDMNISYMGY